MTRSGPTADMTVASLLERWPRAASVLLELQTACPGCAMARFCTLTEVARDYGIPLADLLARLERAVGGPGPSDARAPGPEEPFEPGRGASLALALGCLALLLLQACAGSPSEVASERERVAVAGATAPERAGVEPPGPTPTGLRGFAVVPERPAPDFTLTAHDGRPWRLSEARGRVVALFFGYTHCPDICPQTLNRVRQAVLKLDEALRPEVQVVLVTVDPERDTAERLARYVTAFEPSFLGLRGELAEIEAVSAAYGLRFEKELPPEATDTAAAQGYTVAHSGTVFLIDAAGQMRTTFKGAFTPDEMAQDLRLLLEERRP